VTIKLNGSTAGSVALDAPASTTSNADISFKLPVADGSAGQVLTTDGSGNLSWVTLPTPGITMADSWRIHTDITNNAQPITSYWERGDVSPWEGYLGSTGLTESSGVFTFPSTGWYFVHYSHDFRTSSDVNWVYMGLELTNDSGSNWTNLSYAVGNNGYGDGDTTYHLSCQTSIFDITNVSTQKMRFYVERQTGTVITQGNSNRKQTGFDIFRIGDT
jgi:hypothetical protein